MLLDQYIGDFGSIGQENTHALRLIVANYTVIFYNNENLDFSYGAISFSIAQNLDMNLKVISFSLIFSFFIVLKISGQNQLDTVFVEPLKIESSIDKYSVKILSINGDEIVFPFRFTPGSIYDAYIDSVYAVLILQKRDYYTIWAAYKDSINYEWHRDIGMMIPQKKQTEVSSGEIFSFKILDGLSLEMHYTIEGRPNFMQKILPGLTFPRKSKCLLVQDGLYNDETNSFIQFVLKPDRNSPRPRKKRYGRNR